ncbi:MAG: hypothetical protein JO250_22690 [Armatimonadetes bacterium]|nr:hypothetical protein [Armatimonadota bacterium]
MDTGNNGQSDLLSTVWPPPPTAPPPNPVHLVSAQMFTAGGPVSDFRDGTLRLDADGVHLDGRAAVRAEIAFLLCLFTPAAYAPFIAEAEQHAPGRAAVGRLRRWAPPHVWVFMAPVLALGVVLAGLIVTAYLNAGP